MEDFFYYYYGFVVDSQVMEVENFVSKGVFGCLKIVEVKKKIRSNFQK